MLKIAIVLFAATMLSACAVVESQVEQRCNDDQDQVFNTANYTVTLTCVPRVTEAE